MWDSASYQDIIPDQPPQKANTEPEMCTRHVYWGCGLLDVQPHCGLSQAPAEPMGAQSEWRQRASPSASVLARCWGQMTTETGTWPMRGTLFSWGDSGKLPASSAAERMCLSQKKGSGHSWCLLCTHLGAALAFADSSTTLAFVVLGRPGSGPVLVTFQLFSWQVSSRL